MSSVVGYSTAGALINRAAVQCGLATVVDPYSSVDPDFLRLTELLTTVGEELSQHVKAHLERVYTITTAASALSYDLPSSFLEMVDVTGWDRTNESPLLGPISATTEQALVASGTTSTVSIPFRIQGNVITFAVAPTDGLTLALKYVSSYWVQSDAAGSPDKAAPTVTGDYVLFDPLLVVRALKYQFQTAKGMDNAVALAEYLDRLGYAKMKSTGARILSMAGGGGGATRWISNFNIPDGSW
jgi:hypothetical protein